MSSVLIRNVPTDDLEEIRAATQVQGTSLESYLRDVLHAQASYLRRQAALRSAAERLRTQPAVSGQDRAAVLEAISEAHAERAERLSHLTSG